MKKCFFVHIPKTAGISLKINLQKFYDPSNSLHVYLPVHLQNKNINDYDLVTGHLQPLRSDISKDRIIITWIRNPVDRLVSLYFYQNHYDESNSDSDKKIKAKIDLEKYYKQIETYCSKKENQNQIYKDYFYYLNINDFDFIGVYENTYIEQKAFFQNFFNYNIDSNFLTNVNTMIEKTKNLNYEIDAKLRKKIEKLNSKDMEIYNEILDLKGYSY